MTSYISKFNFYLMASIGAFFVPILWAFASVGIIVVIDTITGVIKAGKKDIKDVKSRRLGHVISKLIYYMSAILIGRISELYIDDQIPFVKLCLVVVLIIEVKSIDENFRDTFGFSFVDKMLNAFKYFNRKD
jgi:phage-related holin